MDIVLARTQEVKKVHAYVLAGLTKAQENQMVAEAFFCTKSFHHVPERSEGFDRMLRVVVVPRHPVIAEKRQHLLRFFSKRSLTFTVVSLCKLLSEIRR